MIEDELTPGASSALVMANIDGLLDAVQVLLFIAFSICIVDYDRVTRYKTSF